MAPTSALWELANERSGGALAEKIVELRTQGLSWSEVAFELRIGNIVRASGETVRQWAKALGIETQDTTVSPESEVGAA